MADIGRYEEVTPVMKKKKTVWDVYNHEAKRVDHELIKDWRESLNSLLVFTAIFSAILAAFIIESKKMLEQDPVELLVRMTLLNANNNIRNLSNPLLTQPDFEPTAVAITVNCLLFASLGASLVAALASVVALQWVADYDAAITRGGSSPEDRAKRRQFRFAGVVDWKMGEIIATLPLLLYSSVALFWAGIIQWIYSIHPTVGVKLFGTLNPGNASVSTLASDSTSWFDMTEPVLPPPRTLAPWVTNHLLVHPASRQREEIEAEQNPWLRQEALGWLARELTISVDSNSHLLLLVGELLSSNQPLSSRVIDAPWWEILDSLGRHAMRQIIDETLPASDYKTIGTLVNWCSNPDIARKIAASANYETNPANDLYWSQCCFEAANSELSQMKAAENMAFLLARDSPVPSVDSRYELEATVKFIKWRNQAGPKSADVWIDIFYQADLYSSAFLESCVQCFQLVMQCYALSLYRPLWPSARSRFYLEGCV
ncbi:hypothetical protein M408DRAFT_21040 [Serendipita vermifera MAFF 305830]|uniref:DUF6535 domain-containing protein n=1 Tax=Serendipita vermifera MAFF 305830 TaxID=933852 RepID=A0A0C3BK15_SERVB|nr:hypothetical protein M408DRAFT_21040 [Serendipita vermifera MAFF 305830]